ncbi:DUF2948 family protein [Tropicimonas isoalkanivorans]|uniref:DUF2948 family protein n=1 Tax=Tropicimonas isoalkanivorans TaxID=441112 RepID=A0A1I1ML13_9RHOB|nr:DUF2948 family protein [Tropicimonas isoalkanivorans]SFC86127.1 Protein of unknown function [Tropicimonas isoalkanivorans]
MSDATFEEGAERPVFVAATDADDLHVISAMVQDAVLPITEMTWDRPRRRFALLLNRFRWEDRAAAEQRGRPYERVQSLLLIDDVTKVASQGIDRSDKDTILSILTISFAPGEDGTGRVELVLAGDGAIALDVECLNVTLRDVTRPYLAPSGHVPKHGL